VDDENNIFTLADANSGTVLKINETENSVIQLASNQGTGWASCPAVLDSKVYFVSDNIRDVFWSLDPREGWSLKTRYMRLRDPKGVGLPSATWKKSMAACELDGHIYTLFRDGQLVKINPDTYDAEILCRLAQAESYGLTFHPKKKNLLYLSYYDASGGTNAHSICTIDINDIENSFQKITGPTNGGHRDGELAISQFKNPRQIFFDPDGNLYIADAGNHCIRKITTEDRVETVVGIPGKAGWKDGGKDDALFSSPMGIGVTKNGTVYVGDNGNSRIRKLAIE
jgi:DNA-binding beta-propeller fold protein YncE